jgi:hypothetical protein
MRSMTDEGGGHERALRRRPHPSRFATTLSRVAGEGRETLARPPHPAFVIFSSPPMYGRSASGTVTDRSAFW